MMNVVVEEEEEALLLLVDDGLPRTSLNDGKGSLHAM